jgi:hypothetical protein
MYTKSNFRTVVGALALSVFVTSDAFSADGDKIRIHLGDRAVTATLNDSPEARDFKAMLPLSLRMHDLLSREKIAELPRPVSETSQGAPTYDVGDLGYWRPSRHFVIYYANDGTKLPPPGIVLLGKIDGPMANFDVPGDIDVAVELAK